MRNTKTYLPARRPDILTSSTMFLVNHLDDASKNVPRRTTQSLRRRFSPQTCRGNDGNLSCFPQSQDEHKPAATEECGERTTTPEREGCCRRISCQHLAESQDERELFLVLFGADSAARADKGRRLESGRAGGGRNHGDRRDRD